VDTAQRSNASDAAEVAVPVGPGLECAEGLSLPPAAEELLPRLFEHCQRLQVTGELGGGFSAGRVLLVQAYRAEGIAELPAVAKLGPGPLIAQEFAAYRAHIRGRVSAVPEIGSQPVYTADGAWGALRYSLIGSGLFAVETLGDYGRHAALADLVHVLENRLFVHLGFLWRQAETRSSTFGHSGYDRLLPVNLVIEPSTGWSDEAPGPSVPVGRELSAGQGLPSTLALGERVALHAFVVTEVEPDAGRVTLDAPGGGCRVRLEPVARCADFRVGERVDEPLWGIVRATRASLLSEAFGPAVSAELLATFRDILERPRTLRIGSIHGDLNLANVLVDLEARTVRLIDFEASREDHALHDLLRLETGVLTRWLADELPPAELSATVTGELLRQLHEAPEREPAHAALRKPYVALVAIRRAAAELLAAPDDWREYYEGLAIYLLGAGKYGNLGPAARSVAWDGAMVALNLAGAGPSDAGRLDGALAALLERNPALEAYRHGRLAEWSGPRYELDERFVALTLLMDAGEEAVGGRWQAQARRHSDLASLLAEVDDPAVVLLGPPGCGKSTLLRHFELARAEAGLRGVGEDTLTFFVPLNRYGGAGPDGLPPPPEAWLAAEWQRYYPQLPPLGELLAAGRIVLLLDALNEMPHRTNAEYRARILAWKAFVHHVAALGTGSRIVFTCRSLDYSAPLSTPVLRVPQVQVQPLDDAQVRVFLECYAPEQAAALWAALAGTPQLELVRAPYFLKLLVDQADAAGGVPADRAGLFTGFVRQAMTREIQRDNRLFQPDGLVAERDYERVVLGQGWRDEHELPRRGLLFPALASLAYDMQAATLAGEVCQVRIGYDEALARIGSARAEEILRAGAALGVLNEDRPRDEVLFVHQLLQEYFAARRLAETPDPALVRSAWRAADVAPCVGELIEALPPAEELPALPQTGWEETTLLAAAMTSEPEAFVRGIMATNLALAGRSAALAGVRERLPEALLDSLRWSLVDRSRHPEADLRARIGAGLALGPLGDPRFERRMGPFGEYLLPPLVTIPAGVYPIGEDEPIWFADEERWVRTHMPRHVVPLASYQIARFPVTNAEWACFIAAGGYDDERWWDTAAGRAWRRGEGTAEGSRANARLSLRQMRQRPELLGQFHGDGHMDDETFERWQRRLVMSEAELEAHLAELHPDRRLTEPRHWRTAAFNNASQPVTGICWHELRAFARWLAAQSGIAFRLLTEVEWEAAARGRAGRAYPYGDEFNSECCNMVTTHLRGPSPVGVFVEGDTPEGVTDLSGNVQEWTSSAFGSWEDDPEGLAPRHGYPYVPGDGREWADTGNEIARVVRGGSWDFHPGFGRATARHDVVPPVVRMGACGGRLGASVV
jgi:formylglycine-generating enzyme required for sulfatase activity